MQHTTSTSYMVKTGNDKLERAGIISPSISNFVSLIIIVPKGKDSFTYKISYRTVFNFKKINRQLEYWSSPLMRIDRIFSKLHRAKLFSTLVARSDYYSIRLPKDSRKYTAFTAEIANMNFSHHSCSTQLLCTNDKLNSERLRFLFCLSK